MITGIVEMISGKKVLVGFSDGTYKTFINENNLKIKENDELDIENGKIIKVKGINKDLFNEIKDIEGRIFNK